ncbi:hypothetical protein BGW80DRAFT_1280391 [Lactifluus volemus]|nr:hypothetical protein BGW80DRAFT_1280391 [Lactifluus volemus]
MSQPHLDALSDVVAEMVSHLLQEQLAPILSTLKEHARLLDCHTALLNHSTVMNRYNIGKLDDLRELQNNENFMLQFCVRPERRSHPTYHNPPPAPRLRRTNTVVDVASSLLGPCPNRASGPLNEPSSSDSAESTDPSPATSTPDGPARSPSPTPTEPASPPPTSPRAPAGHRRLRRERAFGDVSDPMWTTSRELDLDIVLPPPPPPPPYVMPPAYTEENPTAQNAATTMGAPTPPPSQSDIVASGPRRSTPSAPAVATAVTAPRTGNPEPVSEAGPSRLSERAAGRNAAAMMMMDEGDNAEALRTIGVRNDERERKRLRADTTISLERLPLSEELLERARSCSYPELTPKERRYQYEKLRSLKKLFRPGSTGK